MPIASADIVEERARRIGVVGDVNATTGELRHQPALHRAGSELAASGSAAEIRIPQEPLELGGGEVGVRYQPGTIAQHRLQTGLLELPAPVGRAAVLPDDSGSH